MPFPPPPHPVSAAGRDAGTVSSTTIDDIQQARDLLAHASRIAVLTGAGISTESGIPDFRGPNGVWTKNPAAEKMSSLQHYLGDPEVRRAAWQNRLNSPAWSAAPNAGHRALVSLESGGRLLALLTQNIDELHQQAGSDPALVVELHGTMRSVTCWSCGERGPMGPVLDRVRAGEDDPSCHTCGGILKSATISFGQSLDPDVMARAEAAALDCDLLLAVGSSLTVHPAAGLVPIAKQSGAALIIVNADPTPYDRIADVVLRGPIGELLPALVGT
jgi:NAD-dependent deacetylase